MLLAISVLVAIFFFVAFIIATKSGQFDDTYTPSVRMLFEDELVKDGANNQNFSTKSTDQTFKTN